MDTSKLHLTFRYGVRRAVVPVVSEMCVFQVAQLALQSGLGIQEELENINLFVKDRNISLYPYARIGDQISRGDGSYVDVIINYEKTSLDSSMLTKVQEDGELELSEIRDEFATFLNDLVLYGELC